MGAEAVQLDYIRFNVRASRSKQNVHDVHKVIKYIRQKMHGTGVKLQIDIFGVAAERPNQTIGQDPALFAPDLDAINPMVYPSHYPSGFEGFANPAQYPYEIVYKSLIRAEEVLNSDHNRAKLRPWLQDFDLGAIYTPEMIRLQKQATYDADGFGWLLWNASNRYTAGGLEPSQ